MPEEKKLSILDKIKLLWKAKKAIEEVKPELEKVKQIASQKGGWKTGEFWITICTIVGSIAASATGLIPAQYAAISTSGSALFYALSRGMVKNALPNGGEKPSYKTTEFWINVVSIVGSVAAASSGVVNPKVAQALVVISGIAISFSRGLSKGGVQPI